MDPIRPSISTERAISILLRTTHIAAMAILVGAAFVTRPSLIDLAPLSSPVTRPWKVLTVVSGLALLWTEVRGNRHWIYQGRGLTTLAHIGFLGLIVVSRECTRTAIMGALIIGSLGSHLPRSLRKWSVRHRRVID